MKRIVVAVALAALVLACQQAEKKPFEVADGTYRAEAEQFHNGWKEVVEVTVKDGKIVEVKWDAINEQGGPSKDQLSREGGYKMVELGGAQAEWHEQADVVEAWVVANQSVTTPDAISGATIRYQKFFELLRKALSVQ